jgi:hypothetical protein
MWVQQCKILFPLSLTSTSANYIASTNYYHCGRPKWLYVGASFLTVHLGFLGGFM